MTRRKPPSQHPRQKAKPPHHPVRILIIVLLIVIVATGAAVFFVPQKSLDPALGKHPAVTALYDAKNRIVTIVQRTIKKPAAEPPLPKQQGYTHTDRENMDKLIENEAIQ